jgi:hypothetical protein
MPGRGFLLVARELATGTTEFHWRAAAIHAYYALLLECRDTLARWGSPLPPRANVHHWVRLRLTYATEPDLKRIGDALDLLVRLRNQASYDLQASAVFASPFAALDAIAKATDALTLIDGIDGDAVRRAAAIASLPP